MALRNFAIAAVLAMAPAYAGAVTYNGSFNPGGVLDTAHDIDASGFQGDSIIRASAADAGAAFSQTWTFTALEDLTAGGEGTVRGSSRFSNLSILFDGVAVALAGGVGDTLTFLFPSTVLGAGDDVDVTVAWDDFVGAGNDSSTITFDLVTTGVAPIPLPAAGWMLLGAVAGMGILTRRRKALA
jgi:hypothetical protein